MNQIRKIRAAFVLLYCASIALAPVSAVAQGRAQNPGSIRLNFVNTDVSDVIQGIARHYKANIVYPAQAKIPVSLNVTAVTIQDALRFATAAAGLVFRHVHDTYVVATPANLRQALEPFGERERIKLGVLTPAQAITLLEGALPYLTVRPAGTQILVVGSPEDIAQAHAILNEQDSPAVVAEPVATPEPVTLDNVSAVQIATVLKAMFPGLKVEAIGATDKPGGAVGLAGPRSQVEAARRFLRTVDVPSAPREPEKVYRVYNIKYSSAPALKEFLDKAAPNVTTYIGPDQYSPVQPGFRPLSGATLGTGNVGGGSSTSGGSSSLGGTNAGGAAGVAGGTGGFGAASGEQRKAKEGDRSKMLVLVGTPGQLDSVTEMLKDVDVPPKQVLVDVRVVDTSPERAEQLGMKWSWQPFSFLEAPAGTPVASAQSNARPNTFGQFSRVPWGFQSILSAMVTHKEAKILADPSIQVIDNDDANIFIGDTLNVAVNTVGALGATSTQIESFPIGIVLLVRPRVNSDGNITMRVHPVVSTLTSVDPASGVPNTSSREAETTVMIKDGETVVIGGLIREEMTKTITEVPLLSKLPIVGELFRHRDTDRKRTEILVFITPKIVK